MRLAHDYDNIIAIKEASGDMAQAEEILKKCPSHIQVISGDDALTLPMLLAGAVGTISVLGNALPQPIKRMFHYVENGELEKAYRSHYQLLDMVHLLFDEEGSREVFLIFVWHNVHIGDTIVEVHFCVLREHLIKFLLQISKFGW